ncbi:unnamed protein product [Symbiodinium necroappetens]|uniref:Lon N-terminal domain-containing protein n=1 Tax=Symbiodinium necroappetens TaxID=1628268 RepID=A0A812N6H5_9DINO|nr:unnamed protein product [Symbiodinium necroappetens]
MLLSKPSAPATILPYSPGSSGLPNAPLGPLPSRTRGGSTLLRSCFGVVCPLGLRLSARFLRTRSPRSLRMSSVSGSSGGVEIWRALPEQIPANFDEMMRNRYNDIVREELDGTPFRTLAVMRVPIDSVPDVGFKSDFSFQRGSLQHSAVLHAEREHGGFVGCAVNIPKADYLPRGCVGAELLSVTQQENNIVKVTLRGVAMLRIIDRVCGPDDNGRVLPIVQEVLECGDLEEKQGSEALAQEIKLVEDLFVACGELQTSTGIWAAGDLASRTVADMTAVSMQTVADVQLSGVSSEEQRWPVLASHAAISTFSAAKRSEFLCDPSSTLRRIRSLSKFLKLMQRVLTQKLLAKKA